MPAYGKDSATAGLRFRELMALTLDSLGVRGIKPRPLAKPGPKTSEMLREAAENDANPIPSSDLIGVESWVIDALASGSWAHRMSENLDAAQAKAEAAGLPFYAVVVARDGRPAIDSYAVTTATVLARLIGATDAAGHKS